MLWENGIVHWSEAIWQAEEGSLWKEELLESEKALESRDTHFFSRRLPKKEYWRLLSEFADDMLYLDIETTGLGRQDAITLISTFQKGEMRTYIRGRNLDSFWDDLDSKSFIVTYNGIAFDVPFLERHFGEQIRNPQVDLMYLLRNLGYRGGLKKCEKSLGISRDDDSDIRGMDAVRLWIQYLETDRQEPLQQLIHYNQVDTKNLETLYYKVYNLNLKETPFFDLEYLPEPVSI